MPTRLSSAQRAVLERMAAGARLYWTGAGEWIKYPEGYVVRVRSSTVSALLVAAFIDHAHDTLQDYRLTALDRRALEGSKP